MPLLEIQELGDSVLSFHSLVVLSANFRSDVYLDHLWREHYLLCLQGLEGHDLAPYLAGLHCLRQLLVHLRTLELVQA